MLKGRLLYQAGQKAGLVWLPAYHFTAENFEGKRFSNPHSKGQ